MTKKVIPFRRKRGTVRELARRKPERSGKRHSKPSGSAGGGTTGRPPTEITEAQWSVLGQMAAALCTVEEMADYIGVSRRTFHAAHIKERFERLTRLKAAATKWKVRKRQLESALGGQPVPSIWWGKQHLGQKDKQENSGPGGSAFDQVAGAEERLLQVLEKLAKNKDQR